MSLFSDLAFIGIIATAVMTAFLYLVHFLKISDTDMLTAIGTLFTRDMRKAFFIGLIIHVTAGIGFAFVYLSVAAYFGFNTWTDFVYFGSIVGFAHGLVFSILMVVLVAEHHPLPRFRRRGFSVVAAHGFAHVIYGFTIGVTAAMLPLNLESLPFFRAGVS